MDGLLQEAHQLPIVTRDVTHAVSLHDDSLRVLKDVLNHVEVNAGHDRDEGDVVGHFREDAQLAIIIVAQKSRPMYGKVHAYLTKRSEVGRLESDDLARAHLGSAVAAQELVAEEDDHLGYLILPCDK